jgi:hypothetical protein
VVKKNSEKVKKQPLKTLPGGESAESVTAEKPPKSGAAAEKQIDLKKANRKPAGEKDKKITKRPRPVPEKLPEKLLRIRKRFKKSQSEMILIVNPAEEYPAVNRSRISQYEKGTRLPSLLEVYNYAKFAGVEMEVLVNDNLDLPFE